MSGLPCLERLTLTGNPVTIVLDYRTKILELFGDRAREVSGIPSPLYRTLIS